MPPETQHPDVMAGLIEHTEFLSRRISVLVVDDDDEVREMTAKVLAAIIGNKSEIITARCGADALRIIQSRTFNIIFVDLMMPQMSGLELICHLSGTIKLTNIPVVIMTGTGDEAMISEAVRLSGQAFVLKKPAGMDEIRRVLSMIKL